MVKIFRASVLLFSFLMASPVFADTVVFFPSAKCRVEVIDGWTYKDDGKGTATITAPDKTSSITISTFDAKGKSVEALAKELYKKYKGTNLEKDAAGGYSFYFNKNKSDMNIHKAYQQNYIHAITMTGPKGINDPMAHLLVGTAQSIEFVY